MTRVRVVFGGRNVGILSRKKGRPDYSFAYDPDWIDTGVELSPIHLPLSGDPFEFSIPYFRDLPGLVFDSLPDAYGQKILRQQMQRMPEEDRGPLGMLALVGEDGVGALEYHPSDDATDELSSIAAAEQFAEAIEALEPGAVYAIEERERAFVASAGNIGGKHPKSTGFWNPGTGEVVVGRAWPGAGWRSVVIKYNLNEAAPLDRIEQVYMEMAALSGIACAESFVLPTKRFSHFVSVRFDRGGPENEKVHMHSYAGIQHLDFNQRGSTYEDFLGTVLRVSKSQEQVFEAFRRAVFNVMAHNQDDHPRNFSFLMGADARFSLAPSYDLTLTQPNDGEGNWMSINGKTLGITFRDIDRDIEYLGESFGIRRDAIRDVVDQVQAGIAAFDRLARSYCIGDGYRSYVRQALRANQIGVKVS
ncbi:MAG: type II toxin-antitoxin system HipA family toxin [Opitutales bacterium]|nr:type II toxin-antitoxin system HipA family toxin [Opitutales bacterium]